MTFLILLLLIVVIVFFILRSSGGGNKNTYKSKSSYPSNPKVEITYQVEEKEENLTNRKDDEEQNDAYERTIISNPTEYRIEFEIEIDYQDRNGLETTRQVRVRGYRISDNKKEGELWGYCYLRNGSRTFYASRMKRLVDLDTGEIHTNIVSFLERKYLNSPSGQLDAIIKKRNAEIGILVYVGRLDNQLRQNKKDVIIDYIMSKEPEARITRDTINNYLKDCGKVSKTMFGRLLTQISTETQADKEELINYASLILMSKKGQKNTEEEKVIDHMKKRLLST